MLTELSALLDLLKAKGVRTYEGPLSSDPKTGRSPLCVVVFEPVAAPADDTKDDGKKLPDPDICTCGHGIHEHQNGLCLHGCDEERCGAQ